ncbi:tandem-95 repeat protein [Paenibacillus flagellatus]|uniref:Carbohydrate-binding protein n=1 Tax=Paenibacillus flagellatus TaxID=2211139 RepID=A0A2V5K0A2_9BACL|nr:tandem-95 repeat protein [Paenibacillus flagellatus]PYI52599.1 carbohydrate-binding protein [Paenibacillus flagellatus]
MKRAIGMLLAMVMIVSWIPFRPVHAAAAAANPNLLANGGFETTAANSAWQGGVAAASWTRYVFTGTPLFAVDGNVSHTGARSVRLEASASARGTVFQQIGVTVGKTYRVSGWMKTEDVSSKALVRFQVGRTAGGALLVNIAEAKGTTDWTRFERTVTIPDNATLPAALKVEAFLENSTGRVWFDDFAVEEWVGVQGVSLSPKVVSLQRGETASIEASFVPANASNRALAWSSSDEAVASVDANGTVTAKADGFSVITAASPEGGYADTAVVSVGASPTLTVEPYTGTAAEDGGLEGRLIASDSTGAAVSFAQATSPKNGKVTVYPDGRFAYYPNPDYSGPDEFAFMAQTGKGGPRFAMASIEVQPVNDAPFLDLAWSSTIKNKPLSGRVQQASDTDRDPLVWSKAAEPEHGTLQLNADGTYVYTPQADFVGYDGFRVAASDGKGGRTEGTVRIAVIPETGDFAALFKSRPSYGQHPRLLGDRDDYDRARALIGTDPYMKEWYARLQKEAEPILSTSPLPYAANGANNGAIRDRLLRIGLMYQLSGDARYATRTIQELEALAGYADWGARTNNILAMAELSHAVSLAYDWVYEAMTAEQRANVAEAIRIHVLNVALDWYRGAFTHNGEYNNINLVDNGNFGMAALAIADASPQAGAAAAEVLQGMYRKLQQSLRHYTPDGAWPEGPAYWHYGGQYLSYMIATMNNVLGTDFGLSALPGFEESGAFPGHLLGEGGYFDFFDGGISLAQPESMWFADFFGKPEYAWHLGDLYRRKDVFHPLYLVLYRPGMFDVKPTELDRFYTAIESGSMRSAWDDPDALFASMKGVNETLKSHHDLDAGTFVFDALGVRWAMDSGNEDYSLPGFWDYKYQRWTYYRKKTEGHNTIVVNPVQNPVVQQDPLGTAVRIAQQSKPRGAFSVLDMTNVYRNDAVSMKRGMMLADDRTKLLVQDEMKLKQPSELYWFMHTKASVEIVEGGRAAILRQGDKRLYAKMAEAPAGAVFSVMDAVPLPTSPNPTEQSANFGVRKLAIHMTDVTEANVAVWLVPLYDADPIPASLPAFAPLAAWSIPDGELPPRPARPTLDALTVDGVPVPGFYPSKTYYEAFVPFDSSTVPVVGATSSAGHDVNVTQATAVPGSARIVVRDAAHPANANAYTVAFKRLPLIGRPTGMQQYAVAGVEASAVPEAAQGNTPDKTIDGNLSTRWSAPGRQWLRFDLGSAKPVGAISVAIYNGTLRKAYFDLEASLDGQTWTTLFSGESSGTTLEPETFLVPLTEARYIRLVGSGNSSNNYNSITEVAVYGPPAVSGVELDRSELLLTAAGSTDRLVARVLPDGAGNRSVRWTSTDPGVAVAAADGTVTAVGEGRTTVTATTEEGGFTASAAVVVDTSGPTVAFGGPERVSPVDTVTLSVYASDAVTGVASLDVTLDGGPRPAVMAIAPLELALGEHVVRAVAVDRAGHETVREFRFTVDVAADRLPELVQLGFDRGWLRNNGMLQSLKTKAERAADAQGDPRKLEQALAALEHEVQAQAGKGIDAGFARLLLDGMARMVAASGR